MCIRDRCTRSRLCRTLRQYPCGRKDKAVHPDTAVADEPVSYTHLDVYKRQVYDIVKGVSLPDGPTYGVEYGVLMNIIGRVYAAQVIFEAFTSQRIPQKNDKAEAAQKGISSAPDAI